MTTVQTLPPGVAAGDRIVLFDSVCKLCNGWARFLIRFDREKRFKLATVQSPEGQAILRHFALPIDFFETMLLVEGPQDFRKSTAFIRVVARLPFPWFVAAMVWLIPYPIRDWFYDRVALNRYAIFGRFDACILPHPDHDERFLATVAK